MSEEHRVLGSPRKRPREVWGDRANRICTHPCPRIAQPHSPLERGGGTEQGAHALRFGIRGRRNMQAHPRSSRAECVRKEEEGAAGSGGGGDKDEDGWVRLQ